MQLKNSARIVWTDGDAMLAWEVHILGMEEFREYLGTGKQGEHGVTEWLGQTHSRSARSSLPPPRSGCQS